jgi:hypothetical protein
VLDIVAACYSDNELVDVQKREITLQGKPLAVGCERDPAAFRRKHAKHVTNASEWLDAVQIGAFIDRALLFQYLLPFSFCRVWHYELKRLVAVQPGIKPKRSIWHAIAEAFEGILQALQILGDTVDEFAAAIRQSPASVAILAQLGDLLHHDAHVNVAVLGSFLARTLCKAGPGYRHNSRCGRGFLCARSIERLAGLCR